jgi:hypothetical protein
MVVTVSVPFSELPHGERMALRDVITDRAGGDVQGYDGGGVLVAMPRDRAGFLGIVRAAGFEVLGAEWCFPLGSDRAPDNMRHDGSYPGSRGFWRFVRLGVSRPFVGVAG